MGSLACGILSHNLCTKLAELFGKGSEKQAAPAAEREVRPWPCSVDET